MNIVCYIVTTAFGNFQPIAAKVIDIPGSDERLCMPESWSLPHINLDHAVAFLLQHCPPGAGVCIRPIDSLPALPVLLSRLNAV